MGVRKGWIKAMLGGIWERIAPQTFAELVYMDSAETETVLDAIETLEAHANSKDNQHGVTKAQVGLGSVENYATATQAEAEAGTVTNKFMTPQRVAQAIVKLVTSVAKLTTARKIGITGGVTGTPTAFDGSADINIPVTGIDAGKINTGVLGLAYGGFGKANSTIVQALAHLGGMDINGNGGYSDGGYAGKWAVVAEYTMTATAQSSARMSDIFKVASCNTSDDSLGAGIVSLIACVSYSNVITCKLQQLTPIPYNTRIAAVCKIVETGKLSIKICLSTYQSWSGIKVSTLGGSYSATTLAWFGMLSNANALDALPEGSVYEAQTVPYLTGNDIANNLTTTAIGMALDATQGKVLQDNKLDKTATAASTTKLATARTIALSGGVTGSGSFDGSANLTIAATQVANQSNQKVGVGKAGAAVVGTRKALNFIDGANATVTVADDTTNDRINVTVAATNTTYAAATPSAAGLLSAADKTKLDGIGAGANAYTHPSGDGNLHVPLTGTANSGKVLKAGATAGSLSWGTLAKGDVGLGSVDNTADSAKSVASAAKLTTARTFTLSGGVTGSGSFDGAANLAITATQTANQSNQKVGVGKNGAAVVGTRKAINLVEGSNVTLTVADDATNDRVNVTVTAANITGPVGPQGPKGDKGDTGATGAAGAVGATPAITPKVTALAAGAAPTVTKSGTDAAPTLTFGIPAGATGAQGPKGDTGATGPQGIQGPTGPVNSEGINCGKSKRLIGAYGDLNNYQTPGSFTAMPDTTSRTIGNRPCDESFHLVVDFPINDSQYIFQTVYSITNRIFTRTAIGGIGWGAWRER